MQSVAEPWLLLSIGGSSFLLGLDAFAVNAPFWILVLLGGVLADRIDRSRIIYFFQGIQMLCPVVYRRMMGECDEYVCLATPEPFGAVGPWYFEFGQLSDTEVQHLLDQSRRQVAENEEPEVARKR